MLLPERNSARRIVRLVSCETTVASAAPAMPISSLNMNSGSSAILTSPPVQRPIMERFASPSAFKILLSTNEVHMTGAPMSIMRA